MRVYNDCILQPKDYAFVSFQRGGNDFFGCVAHDGTNVYLISQDETLTGMPINNFTNGLADMYSSWVLEDNYTISHNLQGLLSCSHVSFVPNHINMGVIAPRLVVWLDDNGYNEVRNTNDEQQSEANQITTEFNLSNYETTMLYTGLHSYHSHHDDYMNKPIAPFKGHRIGIELEVEFNRDSTREDFCDIPSNWFYREMDGSLGSYGCEIITIPLLPKDAKSVDVWKSLCDNLGNANSWDTGRCGLHVHIGREILGKTEEQKSETLGRLLYLYHHYIKDTRLNCKIYGRSSGYHESDGKTRIGDAAVLLGKEVLKSKDVAARVKNAMIEKADETRYFDINLKNTYTIEFRKGRGSINPKRIALVVEYCERLCIYAKSTPWQQISYDDFVAFLIATTKNEDLKRIVNDWQ